MLKQLIDIQCYNMKTKKLKRVPQYAFGADAISNWGNMSGVDKANVVTQGVGAVGSMIGNATSGKKPTAAGVIGGIGSGAAMGASIGGPWGAVIGGAIGGITSSIGSGGSVNEQTGEYELPSGIAGLFGHSKSYIRNKAGRIKNGIQARQMSEQVAADYYLENGYNELSLSKGGVVPSTVAYLDDGEMLRTPDGTIGSIPEEGKPTDSNLLNVPVGTQVLSDKIKVPGTNKTFAEMGKKLMKKSNKKANNIYAENSLMLNERNNLIAYQALLDLQEALKSKQIKKNTAAYADGTKGIKPYGYNKNMSDFKYYVDSRSNQNNGPRHIPSSEVASRLGIPYNINAPIGNVDTANARSSKYFNYTGNPGQLPVGNIYGTNSKKPKTPSDNNWLDLIDNIAALAGPIGNIFSGSPERVETYTYDPVYGPTDYNIDPILKEATLSDRIARYNMANINHNTGANMAFGLQSAVNRNKAIANAYATKNNAENQMAFNNAQIANQWGQQYANARHLASVEQAQNDAAARNIRRKGFGDLSTRILLISRDKRLTKRDSAVLEAMLPYLEYGMTSDQLTKLYNNLKR
ncbi:hypothetical protein OJM09_gp13 [uncultured phage cr12_1]|uniref:hypothetical protein n=1 Tax=uncultured phage cr12_1 TaxID=2986409 RepID=UPI001C752A5A|nr:hypothetical protein OJM09_gp13 [uncultured phage cr12_1]